MTDKRKLSDLIPDRANANKGTERGRYALEASLRQFGAGRSILLDKNGRIIAGNKTAEVAADVGLDDVVIVQTDGKQIVAVQRTDLDIDSDAGRGLAYADNRVGELDLDFDVAQIVADIDAGIDLSPFWFENEISALIDESDKTSLSDVNGNDRQLGDKSKQIKAVLYADEVMDFERAIKATGQKNRGMAVVEICRHYLETHEKGQFHVAIESATQVESVA